MHGRLVALAAVFVGLVFPATADAHFESGLYSHTGSGCNSRTDPITVVFYGYATAERSNNHIRFHSGWGGGTGGGQYFASHGICGATTHHAESGTGSRYHIRMRKTYDNDASWGTTTAGTPHHEDLIWYCGHAVDKGGVNLGEGLWSGFDQGRDRIYGILYGKSGHAFGGSTNWGNTQEFKQCDGDWAGSHGSVFWFRMPSTSH
jgi:hypothetical protein